MNERTELTLAELQSRVRRAKEMWSDGRFLVLVDRRGRKLLSFDLDNLFDEHDQNFGAPYTEKQWLYE